MTPFTQTLPTIFCFFHEGRDRYGFGRGTEHHQGKPVTIVESMGETFRLNWLHDPFTPHYPHDSDYGQHLAAMTDQENNR